MTSVYLHQDPRPDHKKKGYIGKTIHSPVDRLKDHVGDALNGCKSNPRKNNWLRKLVSLRLRPILIVLEVVDDSIGFERERYWIAHYKGLGWSLVNATEGGEGLLKYKCAKRTRSKISKSVSITMQDPEIRKKCGLDKVGKKQSVETRRKRGLALKNKPKSIEHRQRLSASGIGKHSKPQSIESNRKRSATLRGRPGQSPSDVIREKIRVGVIASIQRKRGLITN